jgi:hypothetical protein
VDGLSDPSVTILASLGVAAGLLLLARGLAGYRRLVRVADISTSTIGSLAAGEVRVSGIIEPAEVTLISLLQSVPCVYYRSTIDGNGTMAAGDRGYTEERSIGFRISDGTGSLRVFPRGARFDAPVRFEADSDMAGDEPSGLDVRRSGSTQLPTIDREAAIADLLTVHDDPPPDFGLASLGRDSRHSYREARLEPGDAVTLVGRAVPFSDLTDPAGADLGVGSDPLLDDPEIAADIAAARTAGILEDDPAIAWGNAAIPGFGIGRPTRTPSIDPAAHALALASSDEAARADQTFSIAPETLVLASFPETPLLIAHGVPGAVVGRSQSRFVVGLLGAVLAIASAMVMAVSISSRIAP